jgi:signal transduction histidine kinase
MNRIQPVIRISLLLLSALFIFAATLITVSSVQAEEKQIKIGVLAKRGAKHCLQKWSPTAEYLSRNISGYSFAIVPLSFDQLIPATEKSEIDFVMSNSSYYVTLEINQRVDRLVTLINKDVNGKPMTTFAGVIFTLANRQDIIYMKDLIDKRFIGADSRSLGGWLATLRELKQAGINPQKDFSTLSFAGTHDATVYAVRDDLADVGCVRTSTLERMAKEGKINLADFKVIHGHPHYKSILSAHHLLHSTRAYPEWPLAKLKHVDDVLAGQVAKTLIDMPSSSYAARRSHSFGWSVPLNYQSVHEGMRELRIGPYRDYGKVSVADVFKQYWAYILAVFVTLLLFFVLFIRLKKLNFNLEKAVTKQKKTEIERKRLILELSESSDKIKLFAYSVSHDLKNPAIALHGITNLFIKKYRDTLDEKGTLYCDRILKLSDHIISLVEQINLYMSTREHPIVLETISSKKIFQTIRQEYSSQLSQRGIKWLESELDIDIRADRLALLRVFRNFIDNSLKYGGDGLSTIEIGYNESNEAHIFSIKDDGVGLDPEDCQKIFDPFKKSKAVSEVEGSGLGLAIVKEIAELHHGKVWGESDGKSGVTFYFAIAKNL